MATLRPGASEERAAGASLSNSHETGLFNSHNGSSEKTGVYGDGVSIWRERERGGRKKKNGVGWLGEMRPLHQLAPFTFATEAETQSDAQYFNNSRCH